eukprot:4141607-Pyramimonas_sp.AAC.2
MGGRRASFVNLLILIAIRRWRPPEPVLGTLSQEEAELRKFAANPDLRPTADARWAAAYNCKWHKAFPNPDFSRICLLERAPGKSFCIGDLLYLCSEKNHSLGMLDALEVTSVQQDCHTAKARFVLPLDSQPSVDFFRRAHKTVVSYAEKGITLQLCSYDIEWGASDAGELLVTVNMLTRQEIVDVSPVPPKIKKLPRITRDAEGGPGPLAIEDEQPEAPGAEYAPQVDSLVEELLGGASGRSHNEADDLENEWMESDQKELDEEGALAREKALVAANASTFGVHNAEADPEGGSQPRDALGGSEDLLRRIEARYDELDEGLEVDPVELQHDASLAEVAFGSISDAATDGTHATLLKTLLCNLTHPGHMEDAMRMWFAAFQDSVRVLRQRQSCMEGGNQPLGGVLGPPGSDTFYPQLSALELEGWPVGERCVRLVHWTDPSRRVGRIPQLRTGDGESILSFTDFSARARDVGVHVVWSVPRQDNNKSFVGAIKSVVHPAIGIRMLKTKIDRPRVPIDVIKLCDMWEHAISCITGVALDSWTSTHDVLKPSSSAAKQTHGWPRVNQRQSPWSYQTCSKWCGLMRSATYASALPPCIESGAAQHQSAEVLRPNMPNMFVCLVVPLLLVIMVDLLLLVLFIP